MSTDWSDHHGDFFAGRRVLVTGGAGFIGSHIVHALAALGAKVTALDDLSGGEWANLADLPPGVEVEQVTGSILDRDLLADATAGCDCVFHQAALGSVPGSLEAPENYYRVNVEGTVAVLQAARSAGVRRVTFAASSSAYGDRSDAHGSDAPQPRHEDLPPSPASPYAATKLAGEHAIRAWAESLEVDGVSLRYFNIFGPRQSPHSAYAAVIAAFAAALHEGRSPVIFGDGRQSRDFTYVANAVHANLLAARRPGPLGGRVVNVAAGSAIDLNHLYREMADRFGQPDLEPQYRPARRGDVRHSLADLSRVRDVLGYQPLVGFSDGLAATAAWYRQHLASA